MEGGRRSKCPRLMSTGDDKEGMTTRLQQRLHREENLRHVLNNHVVCENISSFLSLPDMKAASQASRQFLQAIRGTRRFAQTAVLAITDKNLQDMTEYKWRGVKVDVTDVTDPATILEDLPRLLKSAEFVFLKGSTWVIEDRAVKDATAVSLLSAVLSVTPKLCHLKMDIRFLFSNVGVVFSSPAVRQTLKNLDRLDLMTDAKCHRRYLPRSFNSNKEDALFWRNFGELTGLPERLKCFKLTELTPSQKRSVGSLHCSVLRLLKNNQTTLEELELHSNVWSAQEPQTVTLSALKTLTATVLCVDWDGRTLREFLKKQRSLKELTLETVTWVLPTEDPTECSLTKLHLTVQLELDWNALASMNGLKDFRLRMLRGLENGNRLLASLPKDQLECLSLEGLWPKWRGPFGFWSANGVETELAVKKQLFQGFRCLRTLRLLECRDAVHDQLMQWLLQEFVSLEELQLSECSTLTDAGISGKTTAAWGRDSSFADLRRLETLKIVRCGVTPNGVLASCVNVPSLRSLEYTNPPGQIEESVVMKLAERNPRLERLTLDYDGDVHDLEKLKAKLKKNPGVELLLAQYDDDG